MRNTVLQYVIISGRQTDTVNQALAIQNSLDSEKRNTLIGNGAGKAPKAQKTKAKRKKKGLKDKLTR